MQRAVSEPFLSGHEGKEGRIKEPSTAATATPATPRSPATAYHNITALASTTGATVAIITTKVQITNASSFCLKESLRITVTLK